MASATPASGTPPKVETITDWFEFLLTVQDIVVIISAEADTEPATG